MSHNFSLTQDGISFTYTVYIYTVCIQVYTRMCGYMHYFQFFSNQKLLERESNESSKGTKEGRKGEGGRVGGKAGKKMAVKK